MNYASNGTDIANVTSYSSGSVVRHGIVIVSNVVGTFNAGETITGGTSSNTQISIQSDAVGMKGVREFDFTRVKQVGMAGSPIYTADTSLDSTSGENLLINGTISVTSGARCHRIWYKI